MESNATSVIRIFPKENKEDEVLIWMYNIAEKAKNDYNALSIEILETNRYVTPKMFIAVNTFKSNDDLEHWHKSEYRNQKINEAKNELANIQQSDFFQNLGLWSESKHTKQKSPKRWKVFILTVCMIFFSIQVIGQFILNPILQYLPLHSLIQSFISLTILVAIVSFIIMPMLTKKLYKYLI